MKVQSFPCLVKLWLLLSRGIISKNTPVVHCDNFMTKTFRAKDCIMVQMCLVALEMFGEWKRNELWNVQSQNLVYNYSSNHWVYNILSGVFSFYQCLVKTVLFFQEYTQHYNVYDYKCTISIYYFFDG